MSDEIEIKFLVPAPPEGWVYDGFRIPYEGELIFDAREFCWSIVEKIINPMPMFVAVRVPPPWVPSIAFKPGWIARDENGVGWWYELEPRKGQYNWTQKPEGQISSLRGLNIDWPDVPWDESLTKVGDSGAAP